MLARKTRAWLAMCFILPLAAALAIALPQTALADTNVAELTHGGTTTNYTSLADALGNAVSGDNVSLLASVTLEKSSEVATGVNLDVKDTFTLTVPASETLTVSGSLRFWSGGSYVDNGTILVKKDATFKDDAPVGMGSSTGVIDYEAGASGYLGLVLYIGSTDDSMVKLTAGTIELAAKDSTGTYTSGLMTLKADAAATIPTGKTLLISKLQKAVINGTLAVNGSITVEGFVGVYGTLAMGTGTIDNSKGTLVIYKGLQLPTTDYTVLFSTNGGSLSLGKTLPVVAGNKVTLPDAPVKDGYNFDGWLQSALGKVSIITPQAFAAAAKAAIKEEVEDTDAADVSDDADISDAVEAVVKDAVVPQGDTVTLLDPGTVVTLTQDTEFTAQYTKYVTVTFDSNKGTDVLSQTVLANEENAVVEPSSPTRKDYEFSGWYTDSDLTKKAVFPATISEDTTYYAKWTPYVIATFDSTNGTTVLSQKVLAGAENAIVEPTAPTKTNAVFDGWYVDSSYTTKASFPATINENTTYYAKWKTDVTASFESNGGTAVASQTVVAGKDGAVVAPTAPTKTGYIFMGWYSDSKLSNSVTFPTTISTDTTYYAKWAVAATVTFNSTGGTAVASQTVASGTQINAPVAPTRSGYTFVGWYTDSGLTTRAVFPYTISGDMTFYARWVLTSSLPATGQALPIAALAAAGLAALFAGIVLVRKKRAGSEEQ